MSGPASWSIDCGDALDWLRALEPGSVDAILTDPPYLNTGTGTSVVSSSRAVPDERQFFDLWMRELWRLMAACLSPRGALFMTLDRRGTSACEQAAFGTDLMVGGVGVWDRGGLGMGYMLRHVHEHFVVARKPQWQRVKTDECDLWRVPWSPANRKHGHEAEKPVELYERAGALLGIGPGWRVADPFAGSGSSAVAVHKLGASWIGCDREANYCALVARRMEAVA